MDLKDAIKKLQNIDAKDLKNIDLSQISDTLLAKPDTIIIAFIALTTLFTSYILYNGNKTKEQELTTTLTEVKDKAAAVEEYKVIDKEYNSYIDSYPEIIATNSLTNKISELAMLNNIQIEKFSPLGENENKYVKITGLSFNISSDNYKNILTFMNNLEEAPIAIRLKRWKGELKDFGASGSRRRNILEPEPEAEKNRIVANIEINNITVKE